MNSSEEESVQTLVRVLPARARQFLGELANLLDDLKAVERFRTKFPDMLSGLPDLCPVDADRLRIVDGRLTELPKGVPPDQLPGQPGDPHDIRLDSLRIRQLRAMVQSIWVAPGAHEREVRVWMLQRRIAAAGALRFLTPKGVLDNAFPPIPFEHALLYLLKSVDMLRYCGGPDCQARYFFAKRRSQKYCSDACALPSQRAFKRQWWSKYGLDWYRRRREARAKEKELTAHSRKRARKSGRRREGSKKRKAAAVRSNGRLGGRSKKKA